MKLLFKFLFTLMLVCLQIDSYASAAENNEATVFQVDEYVEDTLSDNEATITRSTSKNLKNTSIQHPVVDKVQLAVIKQHSYLLTQFCTITYSKQDICYGLLFLQQLF